MTPEGQNRARRTVKEHLYDRGYRNASTFAKAAGFRNLETFTDFLAGRTWPSEGTLVQIANTFGWPPLTLTDIAEGRADPPALAGEDARRLIEFLPNATQQDRDDLREWLAQRTGNNIP